jgi:hypothetical protein
MTLAARQVVNRVAEILAAGPTDAGSRVFARSRVPLSLPELPAVCVYADNESVDRVGVDYPWLQRHELLVLCDGYVQAGDDVDDAMDLLAEQQIAALFGTQAASLLSPLPPCDMRVSGIDRTLQQVGGANVGRLQLQLLVNFHTGCAAPGTLI